jgi:hypothetical protein
MDGIVGRLIGFILMVAGAFIAYYRRPIKNAIGDLEIGRSVGGTLNLVVIFGIFLFFFGLSWFLTGQNLLQLIFGAIFGSA